MRYLWYERLYDHALDRACAASDALVLNLAGAEVHALLQVWSALAELVEALDSTVSPVKARSAFDDVVAYLDVALADISDDERGSA